MLSRINIYEYRWCLWLIRWGECACVCTWMNRVGPRCLFLIAMECAHKWAADGFFCVIICSGVFFLHAFLLNRNASRKRLRCDHRDWFSTANSKYTCVQLEKEGELLCFPISNNWVALYILQCARESRGNWENKIIEWNGGCQQDYKSTCHHDITRERNTPCVCSWRRVSPWIWTEQKPTASQKDVRGALALRAQSGYEPSACDVAIIKACPMRN